MRASAKVILFSLLLTVFATTHADAQNSPVDVSVTYPSVTKNYQTLSLSGTIESSQDALLSPLESGVVAELFVEVGDEVKQGQALLALDNKLGLLAERQAQANLKAAEVALSEAQRLYKEVDTLSKQQLAAKTLVEERSTNVARAEAELSRLQATLDLQQEILKRHVLTSPFSGVIYQRMVDVGEWITPASGVLAIVSQQDKRLSIEVPQEYYGVFSQLNSPIKVMPDSHSQYIVMGSIERLVGVSNRQTRSFTAHIALPSDPKMLIGMSAQAEVTLPDTEQTAFWLPASALKQHPDGGWSIFAAVDNRAKRVIVEILKERGDLVLVTNASVDQAYVTTGVELLSDNVQLNINKNAPAS